MKCENDGFICESLHQDEPSYACSSKVQEDPQDIIAEVNKFLNTLEVIVVEKTQLDFYQVKDAAQILCNQCKEERLKDVGPLDMKKFMAGFPRRFIPLQIKEGKVIQFIHIRQESMYVTQYDIKLNQLSKYAPTIVVDSRTKKSKLISGVFLKWWLNNFESQFSFMI